MDVLAPGLNYIWSLIPNGFSFVVFSLALINAPNIHSDNIRGQLANNISGFASFRTYSDLTPPFTPTTNTRRQLAATETNTVLVKNHDQGHTSAPTILPTTAEITAANTNPCFSKPSTTLKPEANFIIPLPTGITATPTTTTDPSSTTHSSIFLPSETCILAIFSLVVDIPTPGPVLSTALNDAEYALQPSAVAAPSCTITLPASLSSEYGVYTSSLNRWVSEHSKELNELDSVCGENWSETGVVTAYNTQTKMTTTTEKVECTAPVAVFTGVSGNGGDVMTVGAGGSESSTAKATTVGSKSSTETGVVTLTKSKTGTGTVTVTTTTVTSSVMISITGSATTVAVVTSSQPASGPQAGSAAKMTGAMVAAMVVTGFWAAVVVVL